MTEEDPENSADYPTSSAHDDVILVDVLCNADGPRRISSSIH